MASKNEVKLTFAGDADKLTAAAKKAEGAVKTVGDEAAKTGSKMQEADRPASTLESGIGRLGAAAAGMSAAIGDAGGAVTGLADFMDRGRRVAAEKARALADVEQAGIDAKQAMRDLKQAQLDLTQSMIDGKQADVDMEQAQIDLEQAALDASEADKEYAKAVKEHGKNSTEAKQALIDLKQATADVTQADVDAEQARADAAQALEDGRQATLDATQATRDGKDAALDLAEAQHALDSGPMSKWGAAIDSVTPLLLGVVGATNLLAMAHSALSLATIKSTAASVAARAVTIAQSVATGIATAAQWLWNVALTANPIGIIIVAIAALVAIIILIATKTTWFQTAWRVAWRGIRSAAQAVWDWLGGAFSWLGNQLGAIPRRLRSAFSGLFNIITAPWRAAFNFISRAWNNTVGRLHWSVPGWVPGIGGASISAPRLPTFHGGGIVPGAPGQEMLALLQAGERVTPAGQSREPIVIEIRGDGSRLAEALVELLEGAIRGRGDLALGGTR
jgi:hypothetical protein